MKDFVQNINHQFYNFILNYDITENNIIRKIIHSNTVAETCFSIACKLGLNENDRQIAYLTGILHDIGRFEQWKLYKTYNDNISVDHEELSYQLCDKFDLSMIDEQDIEIVKLTIKHHEYKYTGPNERIKLFNNILINADCYANVINTANGAQRMTESKDGVTPELLDDFLNLKFIYKYNPQTKLDRALMLSAHIYYVNYDFLKQQIFDYNFIDVIRDYLITFLNDEDKITYFNAIETLKQRYFDPKYTINID